MSEFQGANQAQANLQVSPDRLTLTLSVRSGPGGEGVDPAAVLLRLDEMKIPVDEALKARISSLAGADGRILTPEPVVLLQGTPPVHDSPPRVEVLLGEQASAKDEFSHYERSRFISVQQDQPVARLLPAQEGRDGTDVFGKTIPRRRIPAKKIHLGKNVVLDSDGVTVKATSPGSLNVDEHSIRVETFLEIPGNVDFSTGNIRFAGDLLIKGGVADLFEVEGHSIVIQGAVESAKIRATGSLTVYGGICAKEKGCCQASASITAKYITNADIRAGTDVVALSEIANCRIVCGGRLKVEHGPLLGSEVIARGGVECRVLGCPSQVRCVVDVGTDAEFETSAVKLLSELEVQKQKIDRTRQLVQPLMANPKRLTPPQKEKATELLYEADLLEKEIKKRLEELLTGYHEAQARSRAEILVAEKVFPGVVIRLPGLEGTVAKLIQGPVRIIARDVHGEPRVVAINTISGSAEVLETRYRKNAVMDSIRRLQASDAPKKPSAAA